MTLGTRQRWLVLAAAVLGALLTARLGLWQLDRAQQKISRQRSLEARALLPPLPPAELVRDAAGAAAADDQHHRRTTLQGRWLAERTVFLDNRQMDGRQGFFVVTPLLLPDGDAVLVQRGWLPRDFQDRTRLPPLATPAGVVRVSGRIAPPPGKLFEFSGAEQGAIRQNLVLGLFSREIRVALRPVSLVQTEPEQGVDAAVAAAPAASAAPDALLRHWAAPAADVGKHHGYAFQWFALCALITGLYVWFQLIRPRVQARTQHPD
jgi:surfeit locus 1 family protein